MNSDTSMKKLTEIYILLFCTVHLLYFGFSGYSHIFDAKKMTFVTINCLYLLFAAIILLTFGTATNAVIKKLTPARICVLTYAFSTILSGALSDYFPATFFGISRFEGMFTITLYCTSFILISMYPTRKKYLLYAFSACVTLFSLICVIQLFGLNPLSLYPEGLTFYDAGVLYTTAFLGTTGNTNLTGAFICLALPFLTVIMLKSNGKARILLLLPTILLCFTALKMQVSSTLLGLFAAFTITLPAFFSFSKRKTLLYFTFLFFLLLIVLIFIYLYPFQSGFFAEVHEILNGNLDDTFGSGRIRIWKNVVSQIPDSLIFGKGPDTMKKEAFAPFERYYPARGKVMRTGIDVAHNEPLNILYHQGLLGLCSYLGFIFFIIKGWVKNKSDTLVLALGTAFISYVIQSFFTFSMCVSAPFFWICAGLIDGICLRPADTEFLS